MTITSRKKAIRSWTKLKWLPSNEPKTLIRKFWNFLKVPEAYSTHISIGVGGVPTFTMGDYFEWEKKMAKKYPVRFFITEFIPDRAESIYRGCKRGIWWVRYRTTNRNHILKINSLEPGWHDRDTRMLHSCFQLLVDFVEMELPRREHRIKSAKRRDPEAGLAILNETINDATRLSHTSVQIEATKEKRDLYLWWTHTREKRINAWSDTLIWSDESRLDGSAGDQASYLDHLYDEEDQHMLVRLIAVRNTLWT